MPKRAEANTESVVRHFRALPPAPHHSARAAQAEWAPLPLGERLRVVRGIRHGIAANAGSLARAAGGGVTRPEAEVLSSEVAPLADACRFLEHEARHLLSPRRLGSEGRPAWLSGVTAEVRREPLGIVLVIAPATYPLFLPGVQTLQALAAGNAVLWKPGPGGSAAAGAFATLAAAAGLPPGLLAILGEEPAAARQAISRGVDKVLLTGSAATGREVLADLAGRLVPATMELSGCDPLFVLPGADLDRVARAVRYGQTLHGGATCIAPRRILAPPELARDLEERLGPPPGLGNVTITAVATIDEALAEAARSPYALGASIFGPEPEAATLAPRVRAGVVVINDVIVPTAAPRLPFGGRGESGFGVTRGAEGLLELTAPKVIVTRRSPRLFHLEDSHPGDAELFRAYLTLTHARGLRARLRGGLDLARSLVRRGRS
jgi:acyl-CoA reductase-like NAD-dependent aldehyde dehydrogenase